MKHLNKIVILLITTLFIAGCDNSVERADKTVSLVQENVTSIVNELTEIQLAEGNLQAEFESTIANAGDDLTYFASDDSPIQQNIQRRKEHLTKLEEVRGELDTMIEEFSNQTDNSPLPTEQVTNQITQLQELSQEIVTYISDYRDTIETESIVYKSIANPETDYSSFFAVFDSVSKLHTTNQINLERILGYFEPINAQLINFKVYLANLQESN